MSDVRLLPVEDPTSPGSRPPPGFYTDIALFTDGMASLSEASVLLVFSVLSTLRPHDAPSAR